MKKTNLPDKDQREIIKNTFDVNLNVEASAGTGKTYSMVSRIINGIKKDIFTIDKIVVITYTRKAAAEMKSRIIESLKEVIEKENDEARKKQYFEELVKVNSAQISTVHSFCQSILKERPVEAGMDPLFQIAEDNTEFFNQAFELLLHQVFNETGKIAPDRGWTIKSIISELILEFDYSLRKTGYYHEKSIHNLLNTAIAHRDSELSIPGPPDRGPEAVLEHFKQVVDEHRDAFIDAGRLIEFVDKVDSVVNQVDLKDKEKTIEMLSNVKFKHGGLGKKEFAEQRAAFLEISKELQAELIYTLDYPRLKKRLENLKVMFEEFNNIYSRVMVENSVVDFVGILVRTKELLKNDEAARTYFKDKYIQYFIDEFQDTDPLQAEIISYLCEEKDCFKADWEKIQYTPGKLFVIGDPKQSIYKFNRADIEVYAKMTERIGKRVELSTNFRSNKGIIDFVNAYFGGTIKKEGHYQPAYIPLKVNPDRKIKKKDNKIIVVKSDRYNNWKENKIKISADDIRTEEARLTASWLKNNHGKTFDDYSDVTILFKQYNLLSYLQDAFDATGIPYSVAGGKSYFGRYEIRSLLSVLKAIADPTDSVSIMALLKGPFLGYSDKEIWNWYNQREYKTFNYLGDGETKEENLTGIDKSLARIRQFHFDSYNKYPGDLITELLSIPELIAGITGGFRGSERLQNLMKSIEYIKNSGETNFLDAVDLFGQAIEDNIEMGDLDISAEIKDSVKMMTIHKAKGLQSKVIYLVECKSDNFKSNDLIIRNNKQYFGVANLKSTEFTKKQEDDSKRFEAEAERLRYVAATRAEEYLVVNMFKPGGKVVPFLAHFYSFLDSYESVRVDEIDTDKTDFKSPEKFYSDLKPLKADKFDKKKNKWKNNISKIKETGKKIEFTRLTPSKLKSEDIDNPVELHLEIDEKEYQPYLLQVERHDELGSLVHQLLELGPEVQEKKLPEFTDALKIDFAVALKTEEILQIYKNITGHPVYQRSLKAEKVYRELPIKFTHDNKFYDGVIDLLFKEPDGWVLADYKIIKHETAEELKEKEKHYRNQLNAYKLGLEKAGIPVKEMYLIIPMKN